MKPSPFAALGFPSAGRRRNKEESHRMLFLARTVPSCPLAQPEVTAKTRAVTERAPGEFL